VEEARSRSLDHVENAALAGEVFVNAIHLRDPVANAEVLEISSAFKTKSHFSIIGELMRSSANFPKVGLKRFPNSFI